MSRRPPRILYLPNEPGDFVQRGSRRTLGGLLDAGLIEDVRIVSLLRRVRVGDGPAERARLLQVVQDFKPTIVLLDKPYGTGLRSEHIRAWRSVSDFVFVVSDMDAYHWWSKPLSRDSKALAPLADLVFVPGSSLLVRNYRRAGASDVRWRPHTYDPGTFGRLEITGDTVTRDVVMIGNLVRQRLGRLRTIPGAFDRGRLADALNKEFGSRLGLFGAGWGESIGLGPLPYFEQEMAIRSAWVTANWDHFPAEPDYFSDRLPISLASGTVHFTTWHPGLDERFGELPFLRLVRRWQEMPAAIRSYLESTSPADRIEHAKQARAFVATRLRQDLAIVELLNAGGAGIAQAAAKEAFRGDSRMLSEE
jgi:hypothetical protein